MTGKVCLRCDWSGATGSGACPRCGAQFVGGADPARAGRARTDGEAGSRETRVERSRSGVIATSLLLVAGIVAALIVQRSTPATQPPEHRAGSAHGYLVYASDARGAPRLWVWDLSAATVSPGPALRAIPAELSFSSTASVGWISATVPVGSGLSTAVVLRSLEPNATAETIDRGELVAWLSSGGYVSLARTFDLGGCRSRLVIETDKVSTAFTSRSVELDACGDPTMLGRDLTRPYVTLEWRGDATVYRVGVRRLVPLLHGYRALSVSLNGDLVVQRASGPPGLLYDYPSSAGPPPSPIERRGRPLIPDRVLGWSDDGSAVYVQGRIGAARGVYRITVSPQVRERSPDLLLRTGAAGVSASSTPTGDVYVRSGDAVWYVVDGDRRELALPTGAPNPTGPLLWISTLPYSAAGAT